MKFLVDNQLPVALARFIASKGFDCEHVSERGLDCASDFEICRYAMTPDRIIVSKDEDFCYLAVSRNFKFRLVWVRLGNCRKIELLRSFEGVWPRIESALRAGEQVVELR